MRSPIRFRVDQDSLRQSLTFGESPGKVKVVRFIIQVKPPGYLRDVIRLPAGLRHRVFFFLFIRHLLYPWTLPSIHPLRVAPSPLRRKRT